MSRIPDRVAAARRRSAPLHFVPRRGYAVPNDRRVRLPDAFDPLLSDLECQAQLGLVVAGSQGLGDRFAVHALAAQLPREALPTHWVRLTPRVDPRLAACLAVTWSEARPPFPAADTLYDHLRQAPVLKRQVEWVRSRRAQE